MDNYRTITPPTPVWEAWLAASPRRFIWLSALMIAALYGGTLTFGLTYDDLLLIKAWPLQELHAKWTQPWSERFYRPLINYLFTGQFLLFGQATWGYHLVNLLLGSAILVLFQTILHRLGVERSTALGAALLWLVLPGNGVILTWISAQIDLYSLLFMLAAIQAVLQAAAARRSGAWLLFSLLLAALAYGCKEISITLPLLIVAWLLLLRPLSCRRSLALALPHFLLWGAYFVWRALILGARTVGERGFSHEPWVAARPLAGLAGMAFRYLEALISTLYPLFVLPGLLSALLLAGLLIILAGQLQRHRALFAGYHRQIGFALACTAIGLLPNMLDASPRLLGVPTLATSTLVALALQKLLQEPHSSRPALLVLAMLLCFTWLHSNSRVQACFTQPVYHSTLHYESHDRRRWPFSDLHNLRYEIRQSLLRWTQ